MADELLPVGQQGNKKRLMAVDDDSVAEVVVAQDPELVSDPSGSHQERLLRAVEDNTRALRQLVVGLSLALEVNLEDV